MRTRWAIAVLGVIALAALTITTQMPWLTEPHPAMVEQPVVQTSSNTEPTLACPADAKPAKMDFTMKDVEGRDVSLDSFKGKVVILDFWATWCGPCKVEIPHFIEFQEKYGPKGLQIVGVSVDDHGRQAGALRQGDGHELSGPPGAWPRRCAGCVRSDHGHTRERDDLARRQGVRDAHRAHRQGCLRTRDRVAAVIGACAAASFADAAASRDVTSRCNRPASCPAAPSVACVI